jgi:flagellar hook-length control protein FliK
LGLGSAEGDSAADASAFSGLVPRAAAGEGGGKAPASVGQIAEPNGDGGDKAADPAVEAEGVMAALAPTPPLAPAVVLDLATAAPTGNLTAAVEAETESQPAALPAPTTPGEAAFPAAAAVSAPASASQNGQDAATAEAAPTTDQPTPIAPAPPAAKETSKATTPDLAKAVGEVTATAALADGAGAEGEAGREGSDRSDRGLDLEGRAEAPAKADRSAGLPQGATKADAPVAAPNAGQVLAAAGSEAAPAEGGAAAPRLDAAGSADAGSSPSSTTSPHGHAAAARVAPHLQVGQQILRRFDGGAMSIDLRLDPPELGHVSVKLDVSPDGAVKAAIGADTPAALAELVRGARELERALSQAGLSVDRGALTFDLHDRSGGGPGQQDRQDRSGAANEGFAETTMAPAPALTASLWRAARVDLIA